LSRLRQKVLHCNGFAVIQPDAAAWFTENGALGEWFSEPAIMSWAHGKMHERDRIIGNHSLNNAQMTSAKKLIQDSVNATLLQALILLSRQHEIIVYLHEEREIDLLKEFEDAISKGSQTVSCVYPVYEYVFSLIDNLARCQKILNSVPRVSQKDVIISTYNRLLAPLKEARNKLQHINRHLNNTFSGPLMGSICWIRESSQLIASLSDVAKSNSVAGVALDTHTGKFVAQFVHIENEIHYDLREIIKATREVHEFVVSRFDVQIDGRPYDPSMNFQASRFDFRFSPG
jgi:hypothetical protein